MFRIRTCDRYLFDTDLRDGKQDRCEDFDKEVLAFFRIPDITNVDYMELSLFQSMATGKLDSLRAAIGPISLNRFIDFVLNS